VAQQWPVAIGSDLSIAPQRPLSTGRRLRFLVVLAAEHSNAAGAAGGSADKLTLNAIKQSTDRQRPANSPTRIGNLMIYR